MSQIEALIQKVEVSGQIYRKVLGMNNHVSSCRQSGFSLVELMIVVAIVGLLASIAIPNYDQFVLKSRVARVVTEGASINTYVKTLFALNGVYPTTNQWISPLPVAQEYGISCTGVSMGQGAANDQAVTDLCTYMQAFNPIASGMPAQSPACGEPRDYLYLSDGTNYGILAYCFNGLDLTSSFPDPIRCGGGMCWGLMFKNPGSPVW